jgi:MATE family multidrug resistance protein
VLLFLATPSLRYFDIDKKVVDNTANYVIYLIPGLFIMGIVDNIRKFMVAVGKPVYALSSTFTATLFHPLWCYIFILNLDWGIRGAALCSTITFSITFFIQVIQLRYVKIKEFEQCFHFINSDAFNNLSEFFYLAIPASILLLTSWLSKQTITLMSTRLTVEELAAQGIID